MADNKQNNIKLYASIKKFFEDTKAKFGSYYPKAQSDSRIEYRKGTGETFYETSEVKPDINPKFEDTSLFQKITVKDGYTIIGGTTGQETKGSIPATTATLPGHKHLQGSHNYSEGLGANEWAAYGAINSSGKTARDETNGNFRNYTSTETPAITITQAVAHNTTGTVDAKGYSMIKYVFIAKKDVTFGEMGNIGVATNASI